MHVWPDSIPLGILKIQRHTHKGEAVSGDKEDLSKSAGGETNELAKDGHNNDEHLDGETRELKNLRHRKIYIRIRLPEIRDEIKNLNTETKNLTVSLQNKGGEDQENLKNIRQRKIYTRQRTQALKSEQTALTVERKTVNAALQAAWVRRHLADPTSADSDQDDQTHPPFLSDEVDDQP
jgi:hypothetical protein